MSALHSERNIRSRIQSFESQMNTQEFTPPTVHPRNINTPRPAVAPKPFPNPRASVSSANQEETTPQSFADKINSEGFDSFLGVNIRPPPIAPRPSIRKPSPNSSDPYTPQLSIKSIPQLPSRPSLLTSKSSNSQDEADVFSIQSFSQSAISNELINGNNRNNGMQNEYMGTLVNHAPAALSRGAGSLNNPTRKPTIIRVPSKQEAELSFPSALPVQRTFGVSSSFKQKETYGFGGEPSLPPRRTPSLKNGPARPPPPRRDSVQRYTPAQTQNANKLSRKTPKKRPVLPPRPNPGHRLYNRYTLEIPHAIAEYDYNGMQTGELSFQKNEVLVLLNQLDSRRFECQVGDAKGVVQTCHMKIITPLSNYSQNEFTSAHRDSSSHQAGYGNTGNGSLNVQAIYDFSPEGPGELELRTGDIVMNVEQLDSEWYLGTCNGSTGFFPITYVKPVSGFSAPAAKPRPPTIPAKPASQRISGPRCVARFDFEGEQSDELSFGEGEVIRLLEYAGEEWARGEISGHQGIFPLNFVEVLEDLPPVPEKNQGMAVSHSVQAAPSRLNQVERVLALYDFTAEKDGDLAFQRGDVIDILEHIDEEWSCGRLRGREGIFPISFTQKHTGGFLSR